MKVSGKLLKDHLDDFNKIILYLENIEIPLEDEDQTLLLLRSLPNEFDNLSDTFIYGKDIYSFIRRSTNNFVYKGVEKEVRK